LVSEKPAPTLIGRDSEHDRPLASTVAHNVSATLALLAANPSKNPLGLRARARMMASGYTYPSNDMICWPVSPRVGNVRNNDPSLIEPIVFRSPLVPSLDSRRLSELEGGLRRAKQFR
jgi:hypothetical protein